MNTPRIEVWYKEVTVECLKCGKFEEGLLMKVFLKDEDDEDVAFEEAVAKMQGEFWTWLENTCKVAWVGVLSPHYPEGLWFNGEKAEEILSQL